MPGRSIAYEGYFNGHGFTNASKGSHKLAPSSQHPNAAATYRLPWTPTGSTRGR
jgi:hypothetical protein